MNDQPMTEKDARAIECREAISLAAWPKLLALREKLGRKAKEEKRFRFYSLYGHVCRTDRLEAAWDTVRRNNGAPGVDQVSIEQIAATPESEAAFVAALQKSLRERTYRAQPVRRVLYPEGRREAAAPWIARICLEEKWRAVSLRSAPTIADRVVQAAVRLIIEPIFEADFEDCSHGSGRDAARLTPSRASCKAFKRAATRFTTPTWQGSCQQIWKMNGWLSPCGRLDTIPHDKLIAGLRQRVVDGRVLGLIRQWLGAPVVETPPEDKKGTGPPRVQRRKEGTPQGGVLSPLLANIHLHWFDRAFHGKSGPARWANARLVRYADELLRAASRRSPLRCAAGQPCGWLSRSARLVVLARHVSGRITEWIEERIEGRLGLQINREKTRVISDLRAEGANLTFLGYGLKYAADQHGRQGRQYLRVEPSAKAMKRQREKVRGTVNPKQSHKPLPELIERLNAQLRGWANYFRLGYPRQAFRSLNAYVRAKLTWHLQRRSQRSWRPPAGVAANAHLTRMGLINL